MPKEKPFTVFIQNWTERERGWGQRPDGFTIHLSKEHHRNYVNHYMKTYNNAPVAPDEYTTVDGDPIEIEVDQELYGRIKRASDLKRDDGTVIDGVHGSGNYFSTSPMRPLRDGDIAWPKTKKLTSIEEAIDKIAAWVEKLPITVVDGGPVLRGGKGTQTEYITASKEEIATRIINKEWDK